MPRNFKISDTCLRTYPVVGPSRLQEWSFELVSKIWYKTFLPRKFGSAPNKAFDMQIPNFILFYFLGSLYTPRIECRPPLFLQHLVVNGQWSMVNVSFNFEKEQKRALLINERIRSWSSDSFHLAASWSMKLSSIENGQLVDGCPATLPASSRNCRNY
jgi:hypothetical protein